MDSCSGAAWAANSLADHYAEYVTGNFALVARLAPHVLLELGPVLTYRADTSEPSSELFASNLGRTIQTQLEVAGRSSFRVDF